jgi:hypothetical protein
MSKTTKRTKSGKRKTNKRHIQKGAGWFSTSQQPTTSQPPKWSIFNLFGKKDATTPEQSVADEEEERRKEAEEAEERRKEAEEAEEAEEARKAEEAEKERRKFYNTKEDKYGDEFQGGKKRHLKKSKKSKKYSTKKMR